MAQYDGHRANPDSLGLKHLDLTTYVGSQDIPSAVKGVFFDADGTCTTADAGGGNSVPGIPVTKNQPLWICPARVSAMSGPTKMFGIV